MKTITKFAVVAAAAIMAVGCCSNGSNNSSADCCTKTCKEMKTYEKKYTNADFYKDGVFQEDVAKAAYLDMFEFYGYDVTPFLEKEWWVVDFGLGDFENCGMGGVFWLNDTDFGYFAHDIYLLPNQMLPEHKHYKTDKPAKMESWMVFKGEVKNFAYLVDAKGEAIVTEGYEQYIPETQKESTLCRFYQHQGVGDIVHLKDAGVNEKGEGTWHFLVAGPGGAIVHEYATAHDGAWFTNKKAVM